VSHVALPRNPSATEASHEARPGIVGLIWRRIQRNRQVGRDRRLLQALPASLLADMGLEKIEFRSAADGRRETWIVSHRS
jgi:uncharacterized protein YjiS (DUF1127 family)